jgi:hypothetical protein
MKPYTANAFQRVVLANVTRGVTSAMLAASLASFILIANVQAGEPEDAEQGSDRVGSFDMPGVSAWFNDRFSESELQSYQPEDFRIESHACSCYDRPEPHYPYLLVFFSTPKGDLVGRPDRRGVDTVITRLAVRHGEQYCDVDSEDQCYGSFSQPCDFSDFRFGGQLARYFPTCKSVDSDDELTPVGYRP